MRPKAALFAPLLAAALPLATPSAQVGRPLPPAEVEDLAGTPAGSFDEYVGRTLLIEFFAYW